MQSLLSAGLADTKAADHGGLVQLKTFIDKAVQPIEGEDHDEASLKSSDSTKAASFAALLDTVRQALRSAELSEVAKAATAKQAEPLKSKSELLNDNNFVNTNQSLSKSLKTTSGLKTQAASTRAKLAKKAGTEAATATESTKPASLRPAQAKAADGRPASSRDSTSQARQSGDGSKTRGQASVNSPFTLTGRSLNKPGGFGADNPALAAALSTEFSSSGKAASTGRPSAGAKTINDRNDLVSQEKSQIADKTTKRSVEALQLKTLDKLVEAATVKKAPATKQSKAKQTRTNPGQLGNEPQGQALADAVTTESPKATPNSLANDPIIVVRLTTESDKPSTVGAKTTNSSSLADQLASHLRSGLQADIVRQASLMLRNDGEGLIRLRLEPESLGLVKIRLKLADNKIKGQIVVESDQAFKAFEQDLASLERAFVESGFGGAGLDLALSSQSQPGRGQPETSALPFGRLRSTGDGYDTASLNADTAFIWYEAAVVNVLA